jgi:Arc/MetJ family transcription regulator
MRTTMDIDAETLKTVMKTTGARTKKKAVEVAMQGFLRAKRRQELSDLIGNYDEFALSLEELERVRSVS